MGKDALTDDVVKKVRQAWDYLPNVPKEQQAAYIDKMKQIHQKVVEAYDTGIDPGDNPVDKIAGGALKAADYGAGLIRTGGMDLASTLAGRRDLVKPEDYKDAWSGRGAPPVDEYLKRAGVPEGPHLSDVPGLSKLYSDPSDPKTPHTDTIGWPEKGGMLDPTARGFAGFLGNLGLSWPGVKGAKNWITKATGNTDAQLMAQLNAPQVLQFLKDKAARAGENPMLQKAAGAANYVMDPMGTAASEFGRKYYNSAFTAADQDAVRSGGPTAQLPSTVGYNEGVWGTSPQVEKQFGELATKGNANVAAALKAADEQYPTQRVGKRASRVDTRQFLDDQASIPGKEDAANTAADTVNAMWYPVKGQRSFTMSRANQIKSSFQDLAAGQKGGYDDIPIRPGKAASAGKNEVLSDMLGTAYSKSAKGLRQGIEEALDEAEPGAGGQMFLANRDIGAVQGAKPWLAKATDQKLGQTVQGALPWAGTGAGLATVAGAAKGGVSPTAMAVAALLGGAASTTAARTGGGLLVGKYGASASNALRAAMEEKYGQASREGTPWEALSREIENAKGQNQ